MNIRFIEGKRIRMMDLKVGHVFRRVGDEGIYLKVESIYDSGEKQKIPTYVDLKESIIAHLGDQGEVIIFDAELILSERK